jgi:hypothetical protein
MVSLVCLDILFGLNKTLKTALFSIFIYQILYVANHSEHVSSFQVMEVDIDVLLSKPGIAREQSRHMGIESPECC